MSQEVRNLEPRKVWNFFEDLNAIPRASKKEEKVLAFLKKFAEERDLTWDQDEIGNLIIKKSATPGMENRRSVILQSHVDMVHQKNADTDFDFDTQGIQSYIDGDWVKARGTTLGADNGMGVASILSVLDSDDIPHPALEGLFTVDEEAGMTGAHNLKKDWLQGEILMNLDTEDDDELSIGCAGGVDTNIQWQYEQTDLTGDYLGLKLFVSGLKGGHSGMDIIFGRGNANKIMNRLLLEAAGKFDLRISRIDGGGLRNAIPRESEAQLAVARSDSKAFKSFIEEASAALSKEFATTDPDLTIAIGEAEQPGRVMDKEQQWRFLYAIQCCHDGVRRLSPDVDDLVETSNNVARVLLQDGAAEIKCLSRSDRESAKWDMAWSVAAPWNLLGAQVEHSGSYPGWKLDPNAPMLGMMKDLYEKMFNEEPRVLACHAGLECGLLGQHYPSMEMISFGPTIKGPHSPDERVSIKSVQKFWKYLRQALELVPEKQEVVTD